jgi:hypothetical protein
MTCEAHAILAGREGEERGMETGPGPSVAPQLGAANSQLDLNPAGKRRTTAACMQAREKRNKIQGESLRVHRQTRTHADARSRAHVVSTLLKTWTLVTGQFTGGLSIALVYRVVCSELGKLRYAGIHGPQTRRLHPTMIRGRPSLHWVSHRRVGVRRAKVLLGPEAEAEAEGGKGEKMLRLRNY